MSVINTILISRIIANRGKNKIKEMEVMSENQKEQLLKFYAKIVGINVNELKEVIKNKYLNKISR